MQANTALSLVLFGVVFASGDPVVVHEPLHIGAFQEFGVIEKGVIGGSVLENLQSEWVDHFGAYIVQSITMDERFHVSGGLGGIFQFRKPEVVNGGFPGSQRKAFFIGPSVSEAMYHFGDLEKPYLKLGIGLFPYKYNADAANLGEYLFRSSPYPNVINTGGYLISNSSSAYLQAIKSNWSYRNFKLDLMLITETTIAPLYDGSLAAVGAYRTENGLLEIGAGVNFKRLIQVYPKRTTRENKANGYVYLNGQAMSSNYTLYANRKTFYQTQLKSATNSRDSIKIGAQVHLNDSLAAFVENLEKMPEAARPRIHYYTASGTLLMARATLDLKSLVASELWGKNDLKFFGEVALLGVKDYPVYYTDKLRRMPMMAGLNLPTFKILDLLSVQLEYFNSPYLNNTWPVGSDGNNIPFLPDPSDKITSGKDFYDITTKDNVKWSVLMKKAIGPNVSVFGQIASDHLRIADASWYYGPQLNPNEVTLRKSDWYWMLQLAWGI
jgi:hypothetical protein